MPERPVPHSSSAERRDMSRKEYNREIAAAINQYLCEGNWRHRFDEEEGTFLMPIGFEGRFRRTYCHIYVDEDGYRVMIEFPLVAVGGRVKEQVIEFLCRVNYGQLYGALLMNSRSGEIKVEHYVPCGEAVPSKEVISNSIMRPAQALGCYADGLGEVIYGHMDARQAASECASGGIRRLDALEREAAETDESAEAEDDETDDAEDTAGLDELREMISQILQEGDDDDDIVDDTDDDTDAVTDDDTDEDA